MILAIDHFTRWIEVKTLANITAKKDKKFFYKDAICRFRIPKILISNNGKQSDPKKFRELCEELGIQQRSTSVAHARTNGATEVTNRTILQGLKKRLDTFKGKWLEELPNVL